MDIREYTFNEMMDKLRNLVYSTTSSITKEQYSIPVIERDHLRDVELILREYLLDSHEEYLGMLQGKVYVYEKIIANSNFAPMIADITDNQEGKREGIVINNENGFENGFTNAIMNIIPTQLEEGECR